MKTFLFLLGVSPGDVIMVKAPNALSVTDDVGSTYTRMDDEIWYSVSRTAPRSITVRVEATVASCWFARWIEAEVATEQEAVPA